MKANIKDDQIKEKLELKKMLNVNKRNKKMNKNKIKAIILSIDFISLVSLFATIYLSGILFPNVFMGPGEIAASMKITLTLELAVIILLTIVMLGVSFYLHYRFKNYFQEKKANKTTNENEENEEVVKIEKYK